MRLHKAESALFILFAVTLGAGAALMSAYGIVRNAAQTLPVAEFIDLSISLERLIVIAGICVGMALLVSLFLILPIIRTQLQEEHKLRAMTLSLSQRSETLEIAALTDALTGTQNRRFFDDALREYLAEFAKIDKPIGLLVLDIDHFKLVNDTHGHDVGDLVLQAVANALKDMTRYHDVVARLGGEEFAIVTPNLDEEKLAMLAERIRKDIHGLAIVANNARIRVTISIGMAVWDGKESAAQFYSRADKQLYNAKRTGRNRVCA